MFKNWYELCRIVQPSISVQLSCICNATIQSVSFISFQNAVQMEKNQYVVRFPRYQKDSTIEMNHSIRQLMQWYTVTELIPIAEIRVQQSSSLKTLEAIEIIVTYHTHILYETKDVECSFMYFLMTHQKE